MFVAHPEIMYKERPHADALCGIRCLKNGVDIPAARRREGRGEGEGEGEGQGDREREGRRGRAKRIEGRESETFFAGNSGGRMSKGKRWASSRGTRTGLQAWSSEVASSEH